MFPRIDKGPIEYVMTVRWERIPSEKRDCVRFEFSTTEEFHHFRYAIAIQHTRNKNEIHFILRGLKTQGLLPSSGPASGTVDLCDLDGEYRLLVEKPGQVKNECSVKITRNRIRLIKDFPSAGTFIRYEDR